MALSGLVLLASVLSFSTALAAPHVHHLHHHRKHPFHGKNATALGATGTGTGGYAMPLSTGIVYGSQAPEITVTISPLPESAETGATSTPTETVDVEPVATTDAAAPVASPADGTNSAVSPEDETAPSDACGTETGTLTITSTETDYVTVTADAGEATPAPASAAATTSAPFDMGNSTAVAPTGSGAARASFVAPVSMSSVSSTIDAAAAGTSTGGGFYEVSSTGTSSTAAAPSSSSSTSSSKAVSSTTLATSVLPATTTSAAASAVTTSSTSSPTPLPSSPSVSSGAKRGLSFNDPSLTNAFSQSSNIAWTYNWGNSPTGTIPSNFEYVPMLWGLNPDFTSSWPAAASKAIASGSKHLLSFNEPDLAAQSNISPNDAAAGHKQYMNPFAGKALIGSPAVTNGGGAMGLGWLKSFFEACDGGCKVDYLVIHWYDSAANVPYFKSHIQDAITLAQQNRVPKVWITEFQGSGSVAQQQTFLETVMPFLDGEEAVERYAWFMCADQNLVDGSAMSPLGQTYAS